MPEQVLDRLAPSGVHQGLIARLATEMVSRLAADEPQRVLLLACLGRTLTDPQDDDPFLPTVHFPLVMAEAFGGDPRGIVPLAAAAAVAEVAIGLLDSLMDHDPTPGLEAFGPGEILLGATTLLAGVPPLLLDMLECPAEARRAITRIYALGGFAMSSGQLWDLQHRNEPASLEDALRATELRSGRIFGMFADMAGAIAGASEEARASARRCGTNYGTAMQILGDCRDLAADDERGAPTVIRLLTADTDIPPDVALARAFALAGELLKKALDEPIIATEYGASARSVIESALHRVS